MSALSWPTAWIEVTFNGDIMFYNTNKETGSVLEASQKKTETQEDRILAFFQDNVGAAFGPSRIALYVFGNSVPLTSIRRAITDLTTSGLLVKTGVMIDGRYGKQEHTWTLKGLNHGI
jgi:hypothetical protein